MSSTFLAKVCYLATAPPLVLFASLGLFFFQSYKLQVTSYKSCTQMLLKVAIQSVCLLSAVSLLSIDSNL